MPSWIWGNLAWNVIEKTLNLMFKKVWEPDRPPCCLFYLLMKWCLMLFNCLARAPNYTSLSWLNESGPMCTFRFTSLSWVIDEILMYSPNIFQYCKSDWDKLRWTLVTWWCHWFCRCGIWHSYWTCLEKDRVWSSVDSKIIGVCCHLLFSIGQTTLLKLHMGPWLTPILSDILS